MPVSSFWWKQACAVSYNGKCEDMGARGCFASWTTDWKFEDMQKL